MRTVLLDCSALCYQSLFTPNVMLSNNNMYTGVIYGFLRQLITLSETLKTNRFVFCWDGPRDKSIRKSFYPSYKDRPSAHGRSDAEEVAIQAGFKQFTTLRTHVIPRLGFKNNFYLPEFEADDIIASIVRGYYQEDWGGFCVVSSDADLYQLLDDCYLYLLKKKRMFTCADLMVQYGVTPEQWAEVKTLAGCSTDNVKGIPGVGEKTACAYVKGDLTKGKSFTMINSDEGRAIQTRNRQLVCLPHPNCPDIELYPFQALQYKDSVDVFTEYRFKSFLDGKQAASWKNLIEGRF